MKSKHYFNFKRINSKQLKKGIKIDEIMLVLMVALIALVISMYGKARETPKMAVEKITTKLVKSSLQSPIIDEKELNEIRQMNYSQLKEYFDVKKDFCIYIEDENGKVILAKGSPDLTKDGLYCSG